MSLAAELAGATERFLAGLPLGALARLPFDERVRREWAYWPAARPGVPLAGLDRVQVKAAYRLLAALLPVAA